MNYEYGEGEIGVFIPSVNLEKAKKTAHILKARAGIDCKIVIFVDSERQGYVSVINRLFRASNYKYIVYTAEDAFPGINWLKNAYNTLEQNGQSLLAFNDGKWFGRLAAFGMVRSSWARTNFPSQNLFFENYKAHYADNELTDRAISQREFCFAPDALLIEIDYAKGQSWASNASDKELYAYRRSQVQLGYAISDENVDIDIYSMPKQAERESGAFDKYSVLALIHEVFQPRTYLEIGVQSGKSLCLANCSAYGVDPNPKVQFKLGSSVQLFRQTSDTFFRDSPRLPSFDLSLIDGMHLFEFALRDFINTEKNSSRLGVIVLDDVFPAHRLQGNRIRVTRNWAGDVWRLYSVLKLIRKDLYLFAVDAKPTGLLLIANLNPACSLQLEDYMAVNSNLGDETAEIPVSILERADAPKLSFTELRSRLVDLRERITRTSHPSPMTRPSVTPSLES